MRKSNLIVLRITAVLLVVNTTKSQTNIESSCDLTKCSDETQMIEDYSLVQKVAIKSTSVLITERPRTINTIYSKRKRFTAYCYQGTMLDPNTGCHVQMKDVVIDQKMSRQYLKEGTCYTGCECNYNDCWGSSASCCLDESTNEKNGPETMGNTEYNNPWLARHTCTSRWMCLNKRLVNTLSFDFKSGNIKQYFMTPDREKVYLDENFFKNGFTTSDGAKIYTEEEDYTPYTMTYYGTAHCYSSSKSNIRCSLGIDNKEVAIPMDAITLRGFHRNYIIEIREQLEVLDNGKIIKLEKGRPNEKNREFADYEDSQRAASIESMVEAISGLKVNQMQSIFNSMSNRESIINLQTFVEKILKFLSKKYPKMLSKTLGSDTFYTKWISEEIFQICPCKKDPEMPTYTNCQGNTMFFEGEYVKKNGTEGCLSIDDNKVKNMSLRIFNSSLDVQVLDYDPPQTSASESSTWDWMIQRRSKQFDGGNNFDNGVTEKGGLELPNIGFIVIKDIMLYFCFAYILLQISARFFTVPKTI